jgi:SAM-dependent methyltransferase
MGQPAPPHVLEPSDPQVIGDFDAEAAEYRETVGRSIGWSGKDIDYFAEGKADHLLGLARRHLGDPGTVRALDLGCGIGITDRFLAGRFRELHGVDLAPEAVRRAAETNPGCSYHTYAGGRLPFEDDSFDLVFTICVLHHVPGSDRDQFAGEMRRVLRPGGLAAVFEHNPYNPLTRVVVSRCPFDEDVVLLRAGTTAALMERAGMTPAERRYIFFLPREGAARSRLEHGLRRLPLGAQYFVAARA